MMYGGMRLGLAITLLVLAGCGAEPSSPEPREGQPVAAPFVEIVCTEEGETRLWTPVVEVQPDGVHLDIENRAGEPTSFFGLGLDVDEGRHEEVVTLPPGRMKVACYPYSRHERDAKPVRYDLELVDPQGHWISTELECETDMVAGSTGDYAIPLKGQGQDPVAIVVESVKGLQPDDVVKIAGYPEADAPTVRVVRGEKVIGVYGFLETEDGGLVRGGSHVCASAGLRG
jgi:hypothetical protein